MWTIESLMKLWSEVLIKFKLDFPDYYTMLKQNGWSVGVREKKSSAFGWASRKEKKLILNLHLHRNSTKDMVVDTALHEIAHGIDFCIRGRSNHDAHWKSIAAEIGAMPKARSKTAIGVEYPFVMVLVPVEGAPKYLRGYNRKPRGQVPGRCMRGMFLREDRQGTLDKLWLYTWSQWVKICDEHGITYYKQTEE